MKKLLSFLILTFLLLSQVNAEVWWTVTKNITQTPTIYKTSEEFLKAEGLTCEVATDWCNTITILNWALWASTMMYCEDVYWEKWSYKWSCKKQKEVDLVWNDRDEHGCIGSAWYVWNSEKKECVRPWEEEVSVCTMQYDPVCWIDWVTYGNSCSAGKVKVSYKWECKINWLSENDNNFYLSIRNNLNSTYLAKSDELVKNYEKKISKYSAIKKQKINKSIISALENQINDLIMSYPQDIALPEKVNNKYLSLSLIKFEIQKLSSK